MKSYFDSILDVAEVKKEYRRLAHIHHPDKGGSNEMMQSINRAYHQKLESLNGYEFQEEGKSHIYRYNGKIEQALIDKMQELIHLDIAGDIYLIGTWIWILHTDKSQKEALKTARCRWSGQRQAWYFHTGKYRSKKSSSSLQGIAKKYGVEKIDAVRSQAIEA